MTDEPTAAETDYLADAKEVLELLADQISDDPEMARLPMPERRVVVRSGLDIADTGTRIAVVEQLAALNRAAADIAATIEAHRQTILQGFKALADVAAKLTPMFADYAHASSARDFERDADPAWRDAETAPEVVGFGDTFPGLVEHVQATGDDRRTDTKHGTSA